MRSHWHLVASLPNESLPVGFAIQSEHIALVNSHDPRLLQAHPNVHKFLRSFETPFGQPVTATALILREDHLEKLADVRALTSFRDLVALSAIPIARARAVLYRSHALHYADALEFYPWTLRPPDFEQLVMRTAAEWNLEDIEMFTGHSSAGVSLTTLTADDLDWGLFEVLIDRWNRHFVEQETSDPLDNRVFRSANMAFHAAKLPSVFPVLYDAGRSIALWVSAFEILAHDGSRSDQKRVHDLIESAHFEVAELGERIYSLAYGKGKDDRCLPCAVHRKLHDLRNDYLHGNAVDIERMLSVDDRPSYFWLAPCLFRIALAASLGLRPTGNATGSLRSWERSQIGPDIERALLELRPTLESKSN